MIRTVSGNIAPESLAGKCLVHEPIQNVCNDRLRFGGAAWADERAITETAVEVLANLRTEDGVALLVDGTPNDLGRNAAQLREVSERTGVAIVASAGMYYFPSMLSVERSAENLAELILTECADGLDGTDVKPGILKCATDAEGVTADSAKRLAAMGMVQRQTGLPLYAHCAHVEDSAHRMIDVLLANGAAAGKIAIGHASRRLDADYLTGLLQRGCSLSIDQCFSEEDAERAAPVVVELCRRDFGDRLMFFRDHTIYNDFVPDPKSWFRRGMVAHQATYAYLFRTLQPALRRAGVGEVQCAAFFNRNVLRFLNMD